MDLSFIPCNLFQIYNKTFSFFMVFLIRATPMGVAKKGVPNAIAILNSVLALMNSIFVSMVGVKIRCHLNNSMFFIKKYN